MQKVTNDLFYDLCSILTTNYFAFRAIDRLQKHRAFRNYFNPLCSVYVRVGVAYTYIATSVALSIGVRCFYELSHLIVNPLKIDIIFVIIPVLFY